MTDDKVSDVDVIQRTVTHSINKLCFILSDARAYDKNYLDAYEVAEYEAGRVATDMADSIWAVQTPPANANKFKQRQGAKATMKLEQLDSVGHELISTEATAVRALAARSNYLAQDRADIAYSAKELCREFTVPTKRKYETLKRLATYLAGQPRLVHQYFQEEQVGINVYVDTDSAWCKATRRSTSGGVALHGTHTIKHWSKNPARPNSKALETA